MRRATEFLGRLLPFRVISIHALLAESDLWSSIFRTSVCLFQSTLSLRRATFRCGGNLIVITDFNPRSPCGERRLIRSLTSPVSSISIHALLAESDAPWRPWSASQGISIHALLAESDKPTGGDVRDRSDFNPRSPCGERRLHLRDRVFHCVISIHALLAESDGVDIGFVGYFLNFNPRSPCGERRPASNSLILDSDFNPRSPCGERQADMAAWLTSFPFQSTLSLRRATTLCW